jgi:hypothetical protein
MVQSALMLTQSLAQSQWTSTCFPAISLGNGDCQLSRASSQSVSHMLSWITSYHAPEHTNGIYL